MMPIRYIEYPSHKVVNMKVTGYSLYVNERFYFSTETIQEAEKQARLYCTYNEVEIYPLMKNKEIDMSKVKEQMMREQEQEFELDLSYQEWLMANTEEPSERELNKMEEDFNKSSTVSNRIITHKPLNNTNYKENWSIL